MSKNAKTIVIVLVVLAVVVVGALAMKAPDDRTAGERIGDAVENLDQGIPEAAEQLEDQSAAERVVHDAGEALEEAGESIQQGAEDAAQSIENTVDDAAQSIENAVEGEEQPQQ